MTYLVLKSFIIFNVFSLKFNEVDMFLCKRIKNLTLRTGRKISGRVDRGCHPLLKIEGWISTRATRSNAGPVPNVKMSFGIPNSLKNLSSK